MESLPISKRPTIRDVAAAAQVSISTVSLYVRGSQKVSGETAQRIASAIQQLGYIHRSRGLSASLNGHRPKPGLFGLLMEELPKRAFPQTFYGSAIRAIETEAAKQGLSMLFSSIHEDNLPPMILENQVQGVIVLGGSPDNDALAAKLVERDIPLVLLDNYVPGLSVTSILPDNELGGYSAFRHLVELGHKQIAIIEGPKKYRTLTDRLWGALRAAEELDISLPSTYRQRSISSGFPRKGYREMQQLLSLPKLPTAVFAISDRAAMGAMDAIREAGLRSPEDISLIGFDDEVISEHSSPPLTTIHYDGEAMGRLAMRRLVELIKGNAAPSVRILVSTKLMRRNTTAEPAK